MRDKLIYSMIKYCILNNYSYSEIVDYFKKHGYSINEKTVRELINKNLSNCLNLGYRLS